MQSYQRAASMYKGAAVQTKRERLVVMLYDGWLSALQIARKAIEDGDHELAHRQLMKAQNIVQVLHDTLDMQYEISHNLKRLYEYFLRQLVEANVNKSVEPIDAQYPMVKGLRDAWDEALKQLESPSSTT